MNKKQFNDNCRRGIIILGQISLAAIFLYILNYASNSSLGFTKYILGIIFPIIWFVVITSADKSDIDKRKGK